MADKVPDEVLDALEEVRTDGLVDMLDRSAVISQVHSLAAGEWLKHNRRRYVEALAALRFRPLRQGHAKEAARWLGGRVS